MPKNQKAETKAQPEPERLTEAQRKLLDDFRARQAEAVLVPRPKLEEADDENQSVTLVHKSEAHFDLAEAVLCDALGTADRKFAGSLLNSTLNASASSSQINQSGNVILADSINAAAALKAESPAEGLLISQMVAVHNSAMAIMRRMHQSTTIEQFNSNSNQANKLLRTYTAQMEALKRFRQKASQTVRVERVYVNEGGQAIVGNVNHGGGGEQQKSEVQAHALGYAPGTPMRGQNPEGDAMPIPSDEKRQVSDAWRVIDGSAEGEQERP